MAGKQGHLPVIPVEPEALHAEKLVDFSDESQLRKHVRPEKGMAIDFGNFKVVFHDQCDSFRPHRHMCQRA